jgi:hypothetical protein
MPDGYLDLDPDVVAAAGRGTAATSTSWAAWASRVETVLRSAAAGASESAVTSAFEGYVSTWNPTMHGLAVEVDALGTNATSAANVITNADGTATSALGLPGDAVDGARSHLSRPITP